MTLMRRISTRAGVLALSIAVAPASAFRQQEVSRSEVRSLAAPLLSPDGRSLAYIEGDTLWITPMDSAAVGRRRALAGGVGEERRVARPFLAWSPDSRSLVFRRGAFPFGDPMLIAVADGDTTAVLADSLKGQLQTFAVWYASGPAYSPDGSRLAFLALHRGASPRSLQVFVADRGTGVLEQVTSDSAPKLAVSWSPNGQWLAWSTARTPTRSARIVIADASHPKGAVKALDAAGGRVTRLLWSGSSRYLLTQDGRSIPTMLRISADGSVSADSSRLPAGEYFAWIDNDAALLAGGIRRGPMTVTTARIAFANGDVRPLVGPDTIAQFAGAARTSAGTQVALVLQHGAQAPDVWLQALGQGGTRRNVSSLNAGLEIRHEQRVIEWKVADGKPLYAQLLLPASGQPPGGWPLVVVPYGGYTNTFPRTSYFLDRILLELLEAGFAIARPNTRGVDTEQQTSGYGVVQLEDTQRLVDTLGSQGLVNAKRVAVLGHSHGASLAYYYLTHSQTFCAVVAVNGRADWVMQAEYENDGLLPRPIGATPSERPDLYRASSPVLNADHVTAPLLAVSGAKDSQILPVNARAMVDSLRARGKPATLLHFEDEGHLIDNQDNRARLTSAVMALLRTSCLSPAR